MPARTGDEDNMPAQVEARKSLQEAKRSHVLHVLRIAGYNLEETARLLDIELDELTDLMIELGIDPSGDSDGAHDGACL